MKVLLLNLSDLHIKDANTLSDKRTLEIVEAVKTLSVPEIVFIIVSGDIAFSGKEEEYLIAEQKLNLLKQELEKIPNVEDVKIFIVPGNHDNLYEKEYLRDEILSKAKDNTYKQDLYKLTNFFNFASKYECFIKNKSAENISIDYEEGKIQVVLNNSAPLSAFKYVNGNDDKGIHFISTKTVQNLERYQKKNILSIFVSHHGPEWYDDDSRHIIEEYLRDNINIAIWGHEHCYEPANMLSTLTYKAGVLSGEKEKSNFLIMIVDTKEKKLQEYCFTYLDKDKIYKKRFIKTSDIPYNSKITPREEFLNSRIYKESSILQCTNHDIFVFPRLILKDNSFDYNKEILTMDEFLVQLQKEGTIIISSPSLSGKTTLLNECYSELLNRGKYPIMLSSLDNMKIERLIKYNFCEQYFNEDDIPFQRFEALNKTEKILIVDDLNLIKTQALFEKFLKEAKEIFNTILITTNSEGSEIDVKETIKNSIDDEQKNIAYIEISPFYADKRKELISKVLNQYPNKSSMEKDRLLLAIEHYIENEIKLFQLSPQFIIMFANAYITKSVTTDGNANVFNAVFQASIVNKLNALGTINVQRALQLLQDIAFYINKTKTYPLPFTEFSQIVDEFNKDHTKPVKVNEFINALALVGIIKINSENEIEFVTNSYLAYFIAMALHSHINDEEGVSQIKYLMTNICFGINADILLFLCFLTNNKNVVNWMVEEATTFLSEWKTFDFNANNLDFLTIKFNAPQIKFPTTKDKAQRTKDMVEYEKKVKKETKIKVSKVYDYDPNDINNYVKKQEKVLKLLEIVSKILPNFEHMLKKEELYCICDQIYTLPNKLAYYMLKPFDEDFEKFIDELQEFLNSNRSEENKLPKSVVVLYVQDLMTAIILTLYDFSIKQSITEETLGLLSSEKFNNTLTNKIQRCFVYYYSDNFDALGRLIEEIYDNTEIDSVKFMLKKIAKNYLLTHDVPYKHYAQRFIDRFFPEKEKGKFFVEKLKKIS